MTINEPATKRDFMRMRNWLISVVIVFGCLFLAGGWTIIWAHSDSEHVTRKAACRTAQGQVTSWEFLRKLTMQNATHLTHSQVVYRNAVWSAIESFNVPAQACGLSLAEMRAVAQATIAGVQLPPSGDK